MGTLTGFRPKLDAARRIPADGAPASVLPEWGGVARGPATTFILHPPTDFEIAYRVDRVVVFLPYSGGASDLAVGDGPLRRARLRAGAAVLVPPGTCVRAVQREPVEFLVLSIDPEHAERVASAAAAGRPWSRAPLMDEPDPAVAALAGEIRRSLLADPLAETGYLQIVADAVLARLVCRLVGEAPAAAGGEALSPGTLAALLRRIDERLGDTIRVEDLAAELGLSRSHFSRAFRRMTGVSPRRYLLGRRLCLARDMISAGAADLSAVAVRSGFSSHSHMSAAFRKELGVTPGRYREAFART
jgi:AraC family transcriptional regulator